jgi:flagellar motility protein MotE (MotC chaperone)
MKTIAVPRLLPTTMVVMAVVLALKSVALVRAAAPPAAPVTSLEVAGKAAGKAAEAAIMPAALAASPAPGTDAGEAPAAPSTAPATASGTAPAAAHAMNEAPPVSAAERTLLLDLRQRRAELDTRARALGEREAALSAAEKRLDARLAQLTALQQQLEALDAARRQREQANWTGLVKLYETMRPRDAAVIFNDMDMSVLLPLVDRMKDAKAAAILASMRPEKARDLTMRLAQWRLRENTLGTSGNLSAGKG